MSTSGVPPALVVGTRPQTSAWVLTTGFAVAVFIATLRFAGPSLLPSFEFAISVAAIGVLLAGIAGRYGGSVFAGILAAVLPVFAFNAVSTAVAEPLTIALVGRALRAAAWVAFGGMGLIGGPFGYAIGAATKLRREGLRGHVRRKPERYDVLLVWGFLATAVTVVWLLLPVSATPSSVVGAPVLVAGGLIVAVLLGYRTQGVAVAAVASGIGGSAGLILIGNGFSAMTAGGGASSVVVSLPGLFTGFVVGLPFGLVGYVIGLVLESESTYHEPPRRT